MRGGAEVELAAADGGGGVAGFAEGEALDEAEFFIGGEDDEFALAGDVHAEIARAMPAVKAGSPNIAFGGGHIICGFFPPVEIEMIEE